MLPLQAAALLLLAALVAGGQQRTEVGPPVCHPDCPKYGQVIGNANVRSVVARGGAVSEAGLLLTLPVHVTPLAAGHVLAMGFASEGKATLRALVHRPGARPCGRSQLGNSSAACTASFWHPPTACPAACHRRCPFGRKGEACEIDELEPCRQMPDGEGEAPGSMAAVSCCPRYRPTAAGHSHSSRCSLVRAAYCESVAFRSCECLKRCRAWFCPKDSQGREWCHCKSPVCAAWAGPCASGPRCIRKHGACSRAAPGKPGTAAEATHLRGLPAQPDAFLHQPRGATQPHPPT